VALPGSRPLSDFPRINDLLGLVIEPLGEVGDELEVGAFVVLLLRLMLPELDRD
jgi:hypothetical protein